MAFGGVFILMCIMAIIELIGLLIFLGGVIFLIIYLVKRRTKKIKGFLITAIILLVIGTPFAIGPILSIIPNGN